MKFSKRAISILFVILFCFSFCIPSLAVSLKNPSFELNCKSAILMDANTGTVLYEHNADEKRAPASVTKIMTLLLVFEAIEQGTLKYDDVLSVSERASSMGGSQIFLEPGEQMSVDELLKSVIVASANDAALTLAEHVCGSEEAFIEAMNQRAKELNMENSHFENVTGLDDETTSHLTTARDIALMSRELLKHEKVSEYATIWMDTIRNGEFGLTNTNRLVRFYRGITGVKTGSTSKAGFCVSASAKRENLHLIAVIMGAESPDARNICATKLLDFGFANYAIYKGDKLQIPPIPVYGGVTDYADALYDEKEILINKGDATKIKVEIEVDDFLNAPVNHGDIVGRILYKLNGETICENPVYSVKNIDKISFWQYVGYTFKKFLLK